MEFKKLLQGFLYGIGGSFAGYVVGAIGGQVLPISVNLSLIGASLGFLAPAVEKWFAEE